MIKYELNVNKIGVHFNHVQCDFNVYVTRRLINNLVKKIKQRIMKFSTLKFS